MDSFGTGFLVQSLLALWLYQAFQVSVTTTAAILFWRGICSAISYLVAVPIAERIGVIKTMVFTHLPSNIFLIFVPFAPNLWTAIALLLARSALSQMDVPTRASYVMAVVAPEERPAAASITAVPKTFAWAAGSTIIARERPPCAGPRPYAHGRLGRNSGPNTSEWSLCCHLARCVSRQVRLWPLRRARVGH